MLDEACLWGNELEAVLHKVVVEGEGRPYPQSFHDREAAGVGVGEGFVVVTEDDRLGLQLISLTDPHDCGAEGRPVGCP